MERTDTDQTWCFAVSDLVLQCLPSSKIVDARLSCLPFLVFCLAIVTFWNVFSTAN